MAPSSFSSSFFDRVLLTPLPSSPGFVRFSLRVEARRPPRKESIKIRNRRLRKQLTGTAERPRLLAFCSDKHLYVQVIDDTKKSTILSLSTLQKNILEEEKQTEHPVLDAAKRVGEEVAKHCLNQGITKVILQRKGAAHRERIRAFEIAARDQGLMF